MSCWWSRYSTHVALTGPLKPGRRAPGSGCRCSSVGCSRRPGSPDLPVWCHLDARAAATVRHLGVAPDGWRSGTRLRPSTDDGAYPGKLLERRTEIDVLCHLRAPPCCGAPRGRFTISGTLMSVSNAVSLPTRIRCCPRWYPLSELNTMYGVPWATPFALLSAWLRRPPTTCRRTRSPAAPPASRVRSRGSRGPVMKPVDRAIVGDCCSGR